MSARCARRSTDGPTRRARRRRALASSLLVAVLSTALVACGEADASGTAANGAPADGPPAEGPPADWRRVHSTRFEALLDAHVPLGRTTALDDAALVAFGAALDEEPAAATRAALWLARSRDPRAWALLLDRLERRVVGAARASDAGDCTAAAALGNAALDEAQVARLAELAVGPDPHPDLEVRVECAIAALARGREDVLDLLVRVVRIDTPSEAHLGALTESPTTAWVRGRADEALCRFFELPCDVRTDWSAAQREAWADRLEARVDERRSARR